MKFLNEIDGASKLKQDSSNRLVTDAEKLTWNSKADKTYVDSQDALKADKTYVDNKVKTDVPSGAKFTDTVYVHPNHTGDVTSLADGAQTIANGAVTLAKMANINANTIIGRYTAGTGVPETLAIGSGLNTTSGVLKASIVDNLIADDTDKALSAAQGKALNTNKANVDSPTFTGTPNAPTAATGTDTEQIANAAFVQQELDVHKAEKASDDVHGLKFKGVLLKKTSNQSIPHSTNTTVSWDSAIYDTSNFFNINSPTRITIPDQVSKVKLSANSAWDLSSAGIRGLAIKKNGQAIHGLPFDRRLAEGLRGNSNIKSAVIDVSKNDYFEIIVSQDSGGALNFVGNEDSWFALEVVE